MWWFAIIFGCINLGLLFWRIREEERALKPLREENQLPVEPSA
jgi:isoprenylcysteine carboxyl methyltransferase (ICMT) family protein YpbQ